jgi:hypothetical protein
LCGALLTIVKPAVRSLLNLGRSVRIGYSRQYMNLAAKEYIMKPASAFAVAFMLAASASFTMTAPEAAHGMRESIADRLEDREALRDLLMDRLGGREDLQDRLASAPNRRAALRDLIRDRIEERQALRDLLGDRLKSRDSLRDLLEERMQGREGLRGHILDKLERRAALRELLMDRLERRQALRDLISDRLQGREDLQDLIMDRLERRAAIRDLIADRMGSRDSFEGDYDGSEARYAGAGREREYDEEPMIDREDLRDIILDRIQSGGGLSQVLNQLRDRVNESR